MTPQELFEKILRRVVDLVLLGEAHLKIGRGLQQISDTDPAIPHVAPTFWGMTTIAHFDAAHLYAFKLYDTQRRALTLRYLLQEAQRHAEIFPHTTPAQLAAILGTAQGQIASLQEPLRRIDAKRNRLIAHLESTVVRDPGKVAAATKVTVSDLNRVFSTAETILNELSVAFHNTSMIFELWDSSDYESVARLIAEAKCAQIRRYEAEFGPWTMTPRPKDCPPK